MWFKQLMYQNYSIGLYAQQKACILLLSHSIPIKKIINGKIDYFWYTDGNFELNYSKVFSGIFRYCELNN